VTARRFKKVYVTARRFKKVYVTARRFKKVYVTARRFKKEFELYWYLSYFRTQYNVHRNASTHVIMLAFVHGLSVQLSDVRMHFRSSFLVHSRQCGCMHQLGGRMITETSAESIPACADLHLLGLNAALSVFYTARDNFRSSYYRRVA